MKTLILTMLMVYSSVAFTDEIFLAQAEKKIIHDDAEQQLIIRGMKLQLDAQELTLVCSKKKITTSALKGMLDTFASTDDHFYIQQQGDYMTFFFLPKWKVDRSYSSVQFQISKDDQKTILNIKGTDVTSTYYDVNDGTAVVPVFREVVTEASRTESFSCQEN